MQLKVDVVEFGRMGIARDLQDHLSRGVNALGKDLVDAASDHHLHQIVLIYIRH